MGGILYSKNYEIQDSHQAAPRKGKNGGQGTFKATLHVMAARPYVLFRVLQNT